MLRVIRTLDKDYSVCAPGYVSPSQRKALEMMAHADVEKGMALMRAMAPGISGMYDLPRVHLEPEACRESHHARFCGERYCSLAGAEAARVR